MTPLDQLREALGFGPNLTDEQVVMLVAERITDLSTEVRILREFMDKYTLIKG